MKQTDKRKQWGKWAFIALYVLAIFMMSWQFAAERASLCDYVSINGDFQSYNVFRRILAGQTPYLDFINYIGMAPVAVNLPLVALNNSFSMSLFVTTFTSNVIFCLGVLMLVYLICENLPVSLVVSALVSKVVSTGIFLRLLGPKYGYLFTERFKGLFTPSNSMRGTRSFLPFLLVAFAMLAVFLYKKKTGRTLNWIDALTHPGWTAGMGAVCGAFVVWSNDYGVAVIGAALVLLLVLQAAEHHLKPALFLRNLGAFAAACAAGAFASITLVTAGHPLAWFSATSQSAKYQFFYFNGTDGKNVLTYLFTIGLLWLFVGLCLVFFGCALYKLLTKQAGNRLVYLVFIALSVVAATFIYILGGSGFNCREPLEVMVILGLGAYLLRGLLHLCRRWKRGIGIASFALLVCLLGYYTLQAVTYDAPEQGTYIEGFKGRSTLTGELVDAAALVGDKPVFSTYATGLELVTNQFQPTGCDYIIHALGSDTQRDYARQFREGEYPFAHTSALPVEAWVANQNWFFYRELLPNYQQVFKSEYGWLWERCPSRELDAQVTCRVEQLDGSRVKIICTSDFTEEFTADIKVGYTTRFDGLWNGLLSLGRRAVVASGSCLAGGASQGIALPGESDETFLPVHMENGQGEITLTGSYGDGVLLDVEQAEFVSALPVLSWQ